MARALYSMVAVCSGSSNFRPFLQHLATEEKRKVLDDGKHQSAQSQQSVKSKNVLQRLSYQRFSARKTTSSNSSKVQHPMGIIHSTHKYVWLWFFWSVVKNQFWELHALYLQDGIFGYLTSHEAYCLCVGNHSGHNLHTRGWGDMKMKGQPNRDSNPVPPSEWRNHATDWVNEAGSVCWTS